MLQFVVLTSPESHEVALNQAPVLNRSLTLMQRCEVGLSGFVALNLFQQLAADLACEKSFPTGSLGMASQTTRNLQSANLAAVALTLSKRTDFEPWRQGFGRISELPVEQFFSSVRGQSPNSQLSCRAYWQASARQSLKLKKAIVKEAAPPLEGDEPLSDEKH